MCVTFDKIFDSDLSLKQDIIRTCKAAYNEVRRVSPIHQHLTKDATKILVNSCILSRLDYSRQAISTDCYQSTPTNTELNLVEQNTPNLFSCNCTGSP